MSGPDPGFGLYLHWPFCGSKCPYCDFNSHVREAIDQARWQRALLTELAHYAERTPGRRLTSIFFGGGTPSLMAPETAAAVIAAAKGHWRAAADLEVTLEANPTSSEAEKFHAFAAAGVNRLSIGVQALDDAALKFLGRQHSTTEALEAVALARDAVPRFSFDMIYARPNQAVPAWEVELARALREQPEHISLYQLTIEEGTAFHGARRRGELVELAEDAAADLFECTRAQLAEAGLPAYEISNHARPGAACRHNLTYWRYGDYIGVGPGAHGRLTLGPRKIATRQHRAPEAWLDLVEQAGHATRQETEVNAEERLSELMMMGLRLSEGVTRVAVARETGQALEALIDPARLEKLRDAGFIEIDAVGLRSTPRGMAVLDSVLAALLA